MPKGREPATAAASRSERPTRWSPWERGFLQESVQRSLGVALRGAGHVLELRMRRRVARYRREHARLRRALAIGPRTPIRGHGPELEAELTRWAEGQGGPIAWARTSGTTRAPKRIPYSPRRLRQVRQAWFAAYLRLLAHHPLQRRSLYVFTALEPEPCSLTGLMIGERRRVAWISTLQAPYRLHHLPSVRALAAEYGSTAARLLVLAVTDPGVWYATNPSTLLQFLEGWDAHWDAARSLAAAIAGGRHREARAALFRAAARGAAARVERIAASPRPLDLRALCPSVGAYWCWDGGAVGVFLDGLRARLEPHGLVHVPMHSMSTETLETVTLHLEGGARQAPLAPGVLAEFLPLTAAPDDARALLAPWELAPGEESVLVVSHAHGLARYRTDDVFRCVGRHGDVPLLEFVRRRGLAYSFTGEKLTEPQVRAAFASLRAAQPALAGVHLACVPFAATPPRYRVAVVGLPDGEALDEVALAAAFDRLLSDENREYADKRRSGRLAEPDAFRVSGSDFSSWLLRGTSGATSQLKWTALVPRPWTEEARHGPRRPGPWRARREPYGAPRGPDTAAGSVRRT